MYLDEASEVVRLVPEELRAQPVLKVDQTVREVVFGEPSDHFMVLHVRAPGHVNDEVTELLPVAGNNAKTGNGGSFFKYKIEWN